MSSFWLYKFFSFFCFKKTVPSFFHFQVTSTFFSFPLSVSFLQMLSSPSAFIFRHLIHATITVIFSEYQHFTRIVITKISKVLSAQFHTIFANLVLLELSRAFDTIHHSTCSEMIFSLLSMSLFSPDYLCTSLTSYLLM